MHHTINPWMILPFAVLLGMIAVMPLLAQHWWERHYPKFALSFAVIPLVYYLGFLGDYHRPLHTLHEYVSFIMLIGSLFVVSGGIVIRVKGEAKPWINTVFLGIGAVLANFVGTTGASMLLIRPYLRMNKYRLTSYHVIFFIFIISNIGGCLTPIGDPPLYLGFLKGIPFFWTLQHLYPMWIVGIAWLLIVFFVIDTRNYLRAPPEIREKETAHETWRFEGLQNLIWLALILGSLFISEPLLVREGIMAIAAFCSWKFTRPETHEANDFNWHPALEVTVLFAGIFMTMMPALDWLEVNATRLGISSVSSFYWGTGFLSAVLDNAPTYLNFLSAAQGLFADPQTVQSSPLHYLLTHHTSHIAAISVSAVFFGAFTYIGNGPNFMVKSIADHSWTKMPSFFSYIIKYSLPVLLPLFVLVWFIFFRN
jgi:Na+/H+ antiporter NhaD/arsenite permease-like protein